LTLNDGAAFFNTSSVFIHPYFYLLLPLRPRYDYEKLGFTNILGERGHGVKNGAVREMFSQMVKDGQAKNSVLGAASGYRSQVAISPSGTGTITWVGRSVPKEQRKPW
jgi:hypothetical protein